MPLAAPVAPPAAAEAPPAAPVAAALTEIERQYLPPRSCPPAKGWRQTSFCLLRTVNYDPTPGGAPAVHAEPGSRRVVVGGEAFGADEAQWPKLLTFLATLRGAPVEGADGVLRFGPSAAPLATLRLRRAGPEWKVCAKTAGGPDGFQREAEFSMREADALGLLRELGFRSRGVIEKLRETFVGPEEAAPEAQAELAFDHYPGAPRICDLEAPSEEVLDRCEALLGLRGCAIHGVGALYRREYDGAPRGPADPRDRSSDLTFETALRFSPRRQPDVFAERLARQLRWLAALPGEEEYARRLEAGRGRREDAARREAEAGREAERRRSAGARRGADGGRSDGAREEVARREAEGGGPPCCEATLVARQRGEARHGKRPAEDGDAGDAGERPHCRARGPE